MKHTGPGPLTGRRLERRYVLGEQIARGGMGTVYRARDARLDRPVAVKVLKDSVSEDPRKVRLFQKEARAAAAIADPHVVAVWDQGLDEEHGEPVAFLVMELVDGATLRDLLRRRSPMTVREMLSVVVPMAEGLAAAHRQGLVHRDVKPENVLVSPTGSVKVADFGLTRQVGEESETITLMGSANYIAPEIVRREVSGASADVYAVGIIVFELLTGTPPFRGATPYAVSMAHVDEPMPDPADRFPGLAESVSLLVARCCAKDPRRRPADAGELLTQLENLLDRLPDEDLDRTPPGHRNDGRGLFSVLAPDVHTSPVDLAPNSSGVEDPTEAFAPDSDATADFGAPPVPGLRAGSDPTRVLASGTTPGESDRAADSHAIAVTRDPRQPTRAMTAECTPSRRSARAESSERADPRGTTDPYEPRVVLGSTAPYRAWVWILMWVLAACAAGYLGWLAGVRLLDGGSDGAASTAGLGDGYVQVAAGTP